MYTKRLLLSQIRAVSAARPATAVRLSSTSRPENKANDQQRKGTREGATAPGGRQSQSNIKESWSDVAEGVRGKLRSAANAAGGSIPKSAGQAADQVRDAAKQQAAQARKQVERPASEFAQQARGTVAGAADRARDAVASVADRATDVTARAAKQARGAAAGAVGGAKAAAGEISHKAAEYARNANTLLSESIDAEEDKFASSLSPRTSRRPESPLRPEDVRAAQAQQEANINDLVDELEDKVRNLDHVKQAVARSSASRLSQQPNQKQQQQQQSRKP